MFETLLRREKRMKLKSRTIFCALVLFATMFVAQAAFAQITISVSSTPTSRAITSGHTETIGTITLTVTNEPPVTAAVGTITVDVFNGNVTITTAENVGAAGTCIEVVGVGSAAVTTVFANVACDDSANVSVSQQSGTLVLTIPAGTDLALGDQIIISGVKVTLEGKGKTGTSLRAQISASQGSGINITAGEDNPTVISNILEGLVDAGVVLPAANATPAPPAGSAGLVTVFTNGLVPGTKTTFALDVTENFFDAFKDSTQQGAGYLNDTQIELTFNNIVSGVVIDLAGAAACNVIENAACTGIGVTFSNPQITSANNDNRTNVSFAAGVDISSLITTIRIIGTVSVSGTATLPLSTGTITVQASLGPTGSAYGNNLATVTPAAGAFPRFQRVTRPTPAIPVVNVVLAQTYLLAPLAQRIVAAGPGNTWDTGFSVANTTADNAAVIFGQTTGAAVPQNGTVRFDFFPTSGTACDYTTAASSPGTGLTSGSLGSGRTYIVLLSELLTASAATTASTNHVPCAQALTSLFQGYVIISTNFTNAHGQAFVTNSFSGGNFTSFSDVLVLPPPFVTTRSNNAGEALAK
jgi:hypothetical protein